MDSHYATARLLVMAVKLRGDRLAKQAAGAKGRVDQRITRRGGWFSQRLDRGQDSSTVGRSGSGQSSHDRSTLAQQAVSYTQPLRLPAIQIPDESAQQRQHRQHDHPDHRQQQDIGDLPAGKSAGHGHHHGPGQGHEQQQAHPAQQSPMSRCLGLQRGMQRNIVQ